ncbi:terminase large subunit domain-containing protein [Rhodanobacter terrae]|uniref:Terminase large subunit domain-containing protein n=1 Tax=Rhodanobacter terrae TaxID=418647 RepID=A0ABW0T240_9GAMM
MLMPAPHVDQRRAARSLFFRGWPVTDIADELGIPRTTIESWKSRDEWAKAPMIERAESCIEVRFQTLIEKEKKTGGDFKEIDLLGRQIERLARVRRYQAPGGNEVDLNPNVEARNAGSKKAPKRNEFSEQDAAELRRQFHESLFAYQHTWRHSADERTRMILKSRQIGATWYFAREALDDAIATGRNQIFLSASKAQAHIFKQYIRQFAQETVGIDLKGDPIVLWNGAHLYFLGQNARTAQGHHGNFYYDEFFWSQNFEEINKVASGMAMHKQWRKTYFSTPSATSHAAYPYWTGDRYNRRRKKEDRVEIITDRAAIAAGLRCADKVWRHMVTIEDAERGGCDLFDLDELRTEYPPDEFANLLMCQFMDDGDSLFTLAAMQGCMVDSWVDWTDLKPLLLRPFGMKPVWVGYDPALGQGGDGAGLVVLAPPDKPGGKFRGLERHRLKGMDFEAQAAFIRRITQRYHVQYIGIDVSGLGQAVYQLVIQFFPLVRKITYSPDVKSLMVMKAQNVIDKGRLEFDAGWVDLAQSFMALKRTMTDSGRHVKYSAGRSTEIGHADLAWACMHALINEPLEGRTAANTSQMELY